MLVDDILVFDTLLSCPADVAVTCEHEISHTRNSGERFALGVSLRAGASPTESELKTRSYPLSSSTFTMSHFWA